MGLKKTLISTILSLGMLSCDDKSESIHFSPVIPNNTETNETSFDYCRITENSDRVDHFSSGEQISLETLFESNVDVNSHWIIGPNQIVHPNERAAYEILIVPIGFGDRFKFDKESNEIMMRMLDTLERAFDGVDISFSYLKASIPIGFQYFDRHVQFSNIQEANILLESINHTYPVNSLAFMLYTPNFVGTLQNYPIFSCSGVRDTVSGKVIAIPYLPIHEIGHGLGLGDGYERFFQQGDYYGINGSELFTSLHLLYPNILEAYKEVRPPIVNTGNTCNGEPVYTFYSEDYDIMDRFYDLEELTALLEEGRNPFNPFQIEIMNDFIRRQVGNK